MKKVEDGSYMAGENAQLLIDAAVIDVPEGCVVAVIDGHGWIGPARCVGEVIGMVGFD